MNNDHERANDSLDRYLDRALATFGDDEPRPGLERRVLAHVQAAPKRDRKWVWLAVPAAAALVALAFVLLSSSRRSNPPVEPVTGRSETQRVPAIVGELPKQESQPRVLAKSAHARTRGFRSHGILAAERQRKRLPKLATFPCARPLSEPERMLLALAQNHPEQAREIAAWQREFRKPPDPEALSPEKDE